MNNRFAHARLLWQPLNPAFTNIEILRRMINRKHGLSLKNYDDLHRYSVEDYQFWMDLWQFFGIIYSIPPDKVIDTKKSTEVPLWFPGARLNYAENLLQRNDDAIACTAIGETAVITNYSYRQLRLMVGQMAAALRVNGLLAGDRVAAVVTNSVNAIVLALATASIGGIFSSTAPDMGVKAILDRYCQIQPKFVFAETEILYAGKIIDVSSKALEVVRELGKEGLHMGVLLPSTQTGREVSLPGSITLSRFLASGDARPLTFQQLPFSHPLYILFSSGTTGPPKCIVHSAGGILMQTKKDVGLDFGVGPEDTLLQYTTAGWMMWTLMLAGLSWGARLVVYDGSPFHPDIPTFLRMVNDQNVSVLGMSPRFLVELQGRGIEPLKIGPFEALRTVCLGGAVLAPPVHEWAHQAFGKTARVATAMGGTDICTAFMTSTLSLPVYAGEISCKALGMKLEVYDSSGKNIEHTGEPGELVVTRPHPSVPLYFWGDTTGEKFRSAYFDMFPGVWRQGDFVIRNPITQGFLVLGRSDGVLNPSGVRFGSAEIYSVLEKFSTAVEDTLCIGQRRPFDKDERVLLFVKMRAGQQFTDALKQRIRQAIKDALSARHVPAVIAEVKDIPYTTNGKKIENAVKQIVSGTARSKPNGAVANPEALQEYHKFYNLGEAKL